MAITKAALARRAEREAVLARRAAQADGGRNRWTVDEAEARAARQAGGKAINSPLGLARRLAKRWPDLDDDERAEILRVLAHANIVVPS